MTNLQDHARRELEMVGEDPDVIAWYLTVIEAFEAAGHSGGSASVAIPTLNRLLQFQNLMPLTDSPDEWLDRSLLGGTLMWQNMRDSSAFSEDGGKTYYLLDEWDSEDPAKKIVHVSVPAGV